MQKIILSRMVFHKLEPDILKRIFSDSNHVVLNSRNQGSEIVIESDDEQFIELIAKQASRGEKDD